MWADDAISRKRLAVVLILAGIPASVALAGPPADKGKSNGSSATTTTATKAAPRRTVTLCHRAGSATYYVKINVPVNAVWSHVKRGDVLPSASGRCPAGAKAHKRTR